MAIAFGRLALLACTASVTAHAQATAPAPTLRILPTLWFADSAAEASNRTALHVRVEPIVRALSDADSRVLARQLQAANQLIVALDRHAAYLKVQTLENDRDRVATDALASVSSDQAVIRTAMVTRLRRVPADQVPSLSVYAKLARDAQASAAQRLVPEAERYRAAATTPVERDVVDAYHRQLDLIGTIRGVASPDVTTRRAAIAQRNDAFDAAAPVTATLLATIIDLQNGDAVAHGFRNAAVRKYASLGLTDTLVDHTLAAVAAEAAAYKRYEQVMASRAEKRLGVSPVLFDERNVGAETSARVPYADGRQLILDALAPLGADYARRFGALLDPANGRVDLSGGQHRANTGTSIDAADAPVALYVTSYTGTLANLEEIAHEGGHAIHRELMNADSLPAYLRLGPHDLFEGYAIFNELLLLDQAARVAATPEARERALEGFLDRIAIEVFISAEESSFENNLYVSASGHALLDRTRIDEIYRASIAPYEYWPMSSAGVSRAWMVKPLLFEDPLYYVNYLYASFVAVALYDRLGHDPDFARKYQALLRRGFDADPNTLLASVGLQLDDPALIRGAIALFRAKTDELQALYDAEAKRE